MEATKANQVVRDVFHFYEESGHEEYAGEKVSQLEHMCQAAGLAIGDGQDQEVILAAFFHDLGHLLPVHDESESMNGFGVMDHEKVGAAYLHNVGFDDKICKLIASHVNAKRYLAYKFPEYYNLLSEASKVTLGYQGGVMSAQQANDFEDDALFELYIKMRKWDEAAKIENEPLPDINQFRQMAFNHLVNR